MREGRGARPRQRRSSSLPTEVVPAQPARVRYRPLLGAGCDEILDDLRNRLCPLQYSCWISASVLLMCNTYAPVAWRCTHPCAHSTSDNIQCNQVPCLTPEPWSFASVATCQVSPTQRSNGFAAFPEAEEEKEVVPSPICSLQSTPVAAKREEIFGEFSEQQ